MLHANLNLARRVERAEINFCALAGAVGAPAGIASLKVGGGLALFGRPGSPLNKVLGLGLDGPVSDDDLDRLCAFYAERGAPAQIELCPLVAPELLARLSARGFVLQAFENELARTVDPEIAASFTRPDDARVTLARPDQRDIWLRVTAQGFADAEPAVAGGAAAETLSVDAMMEVMSQFSHPKIRRYLAWLGDQPAGGGAAWVDEGIVGIFGTSTMASFRRRGIQRAIAIGALEDASRDAELAIATTAPGSTSQRTFERLGFSVIYTRAILVKS